MKQKTTKLDSQARYYLEQAGSGISKFRGGQRGNGLGGFFSSLIRGAVPLIKAGLGIAAPRALDVGKKVIVDSLRGKNIRDSVKRRVMEGGEGVKKDIFMRVLGNAKRRRGNKTQSNKKRPDTRPRTAVKKRRIEKRPDIF